MSPTRVIRPQTEQLKIRDLVFDSKSTRLARSRGPEAAETSSGAYRPGYAFPKRRSLVRPTDSRGRHRFESIRPYRNRSRRWTRHRSEASALGVRLQSP